MSQECKSNRSCEAAAAAGSEICQHDDGGRWQVAEDSPKKAAVARLDMANPDSQTRWLRGNAYLLAHRAGASHHAARRKFDLEYFGTQPGVLVIVSLRMFHDLRTCGYLSRGRGSGDRCDWLCQPSLPNIPHTGRTTLCRLNCSDRGAVAYWILRANQARHRLIDAPGRREASEPGRSPAMEGSWRRAAGSLVLLAACLRCRVQQRSRHGGLAVRNSNSDSQCAATRVQGDHL
jgi:hypothetical protein